MSARTNVGVIGLGMASKPHARSLIDLRASGRVARVLGWSPSAERRAAFSAAHGLDTADTLEQLLEDDSIGTVLLLTPPDARAELLDALIAHGKHVLMEKPVERDGAAAEALVSQAERGGVQLGLVLQNRYRDVVRSLAARLSAGELGTLATVRLELPWWREQSYYDEPGRGTRARDGGGVLISQAIHSLDLMQSLAGPVCDVAAIAATTPLHRMECEDFVGAGLQFENGAVGALMATTAACPGAGETLTLVGTEASATLSADALEIAWLDGRRETVREGPDELRVEPGGSATDGPGMGGGADPMAFPHHWHRRCIAAFLDAVEAGRAPVPSARDALAVHALIEALLASARERRHVRPAH